MTFMIATGGTGGHIFPAVAVADEFQAAGHAVVLAGSFRMNVEKIRKKGIPVEEIESRGLSRKELFRPLTWIRTNLKAYFSSRNLLKRIKPDAVISFGSYGSFFLAVAALRERIPIMLHEQNVRPGKANRWLSPFADKIGISFRESEEYFPRGKTVLTGCPCRVSEADQDLDKIYDRFGLQKGSRTALIFGGSQGSRAINKAFLEALSSFPERNHIQVIHISGSDGIDEMRGQYARLGVRAALFEFLDEIEKAYQIADVAICRAGASTVMEIAGYGIPAIIIPYPYAGSHQKDNAMVLKKYPSVRILDEKNLSAEALNQCLGELLTSGVAEKNQRQPYMDIFVADPRKRIVQEAVKLLG